MSFWKSSFPQAEGDFRVALVVADFNASVTEPLLQSTLAALRQCGVPSEATEVFSVPGSFEIPFVAQKLTAQDFDSIIALGCLIRGETIHFELVAETCASGIARVNLESDIPVIFGILACENEEQAISRIVLGADFAKAAVRMMNLTGHLGK